MAKSYTIDQLKAKRAAEWYSVPELAGRWHIQPAEVCRILDRYNITPERFQFGGWTYWQINGSDVYGIEQALKGN